ncbi:hypothetical protein B0T26DRAFT_254584 [Lasiosphaeria miniovina]|uniref:Uncharacterized protein n=1 Tax=Lasiosphaeria miniovina TaxID=1954250 RepID=A0AA40E5H4_9PEZI|nr:uncharacterized protein B0T26DRAFT_254584 [Lasiosphaeria miniovina]KAK0723198.1 hypothetical protein B0T26DRAFT_254584 [Lasiosphaeria miniovina]
MIVDRSRIDGPPEQRLPWQAWPVRPVHDRSGGMLPRCPPSICGGSGWISRSKHGDLTILRPTPEALSAGVHLCGNCPRLSSLGGCGLKSTADWKIACSESGIARRKSP